MKGIVDLSRLDEFFTALAERTEQLSEWLEEGDENLESALRLMAYVVTEWIDWNPALGEKIRQYVDRLHRLLFEVPTSDEVVIPVIWWQTDIGRLCSWALLWAEDDEAITIQEATEIVGKSVGRISHMVTDGSLRPLMNPDAANPQHARRLVSKQEVLRLRGKE